MGIFGIFSQNKTATTQDHLPIEDIRDDLVVLKNGSVSLVLEVSAVNFQLLSEREQEAKIRGFAELLNSITFPLQIVIHTEPKTVKNYIDWLNSYIKKTNNPLIKDQLSRFIDFVRSIVVKQKVLQKKFYVVIPYFSPLIQKESFWDKVKEALGKKRITPAHEIGRQIEAAKIRLFPRRDHVQKLFKRIGIESRQLKTEELVNLFYKLYNATEYVPLEIKAEMEKEAI